MSNIYDKHSHKFCTICYNGPLKWENIKIKLLFKSNNWPHKLGLRSNASVVQSGNIVVFPTSNLAPRSKYIRTHVEGTMKWVKVSFIESLIIVNDLIKWLIRLYRKQLGVRGIATQYWVASCRLHPQEGPSHLYHSILREGRNFESVTCLLDKVRGLVLYTKPYSWTQG